MSTQAATTLYSSLKRKVKMASWEKKDKIASWTGTIPFAGRRRARLSLETNKEKVGPQPEVVITLCLKNDINNR